MVDRNLLREFDISDEEFSTAVYTDGNQEDPMALLEEGQEYVLNTIVHGKVVDIVGDQAIVDVGYKAEGLVPLNEWDETEGRPEPGDEVEVLLEGMDDDTGEILLSRKKAHRMRAWENVISKHAEGDVVTGRVTKKIKGGLLVDIGVNVFLPASQVDIRRPSDIGDYLDTEIQCMILKIDEGRRNIVVSRRKLIEEQRARQKEALLSEIEIGQVRKGVVKNIADFGAFVDLGGIDGLLHITDMSWGRINHPSDMVRIDDTIEVMVLNVDRDREKIALGLKQKSASPWENIGEKYPEGARVTGEVVNVMSYGAFVKLEEGIEGLVHISEMSWTKRINHPSELVQIGDKVEVVVLGINRDKQEISLGMKQTQPNPWDQVAQKYPPGTMVDGTVRNLTNYGAFIEIEEGIDGLLHISDMSWTRKIGHPNELLEKGQQVSCQVLNVDQERKRIALGLKQLKQDPWETDIPDRYHPGDVVVGKVTKLTNFGVFVELEPGLEGLLHISELAEHKVDSPEEIVNVGDDIEVKILRVDRGERKIGLSKKKAGWSKEEIEAEETKAEGAAPGTPAAAAAASSTKSELKGGLGGGGPLFSFGGQEAGEATETEAPAAEASAEPAEPEASAGSTEPEAPAEAAESEDSAESAESEASAEVAESEDKA
jgi:small subunit ribosomal protein S1